MFPVHKMPQASPLGQRDKWWPRGATVQTRTLWVSASPIPCPQQQQLRPGGWGSGEESAWCPGHCSALLLPTAQEPESPPPKRVEPFVCLALPASLKQVLPHHMWGVRTVLPSAQEHGTAGKPGHIKAPKALSWSDELGWLRPKRPAILTLKGD